MAPPPPSMAPRMVALILRVLTFAFLLISIAILTTNTSTLETKYYKEFKIGFKDVSSYRYMLAANVIGMAYTLLQVAFTLNHIFYRNAETSIDSNLVFDFYGDKVISYILATGAAAAFGATSDMKPLLALFKFDKFVSQGYASASFLFLGFVCTAILSVLSSYALPKNV